jgi:YVTN family beta-propeller protein
VTAQPREGTAAATHTFPEVATRGSEKIGLEREIEPQAVAVVPGAKHALVGTPLGLYRVDLGAGTFDPDPLLREPADGDIRVLPDGSLAVVSSSDGLQVVDLATRRVETIEGTKGAAAVAVSPDGRLAFACLMVPDGTGAVVPVDIAARKPAGAQIPAGNAPLGCAFTPDGKTAFVTNAFDGSVTVIDVPSLSAEHAPIELGGNPQTVSVTPDGSQALVTDTEASAIHFVDVASRRLTATLKTGDVYPQDLVLVPDGRFALLPSSEFASVAFLDVGARAFLPDMVKVGSAPNSVAVDPQGLTSVVGNSGEWSISVL